MEIGTFKINHYLIIVFRIKILSAFYIELLVLLHALFYPLSLYSPMAQYYHSTRNPSIVVCVVAV